MRMIAALLVASPTVELCPLGRCRPAGPTGTACPGRLTGDIAMVGQVRFDYAADRGAGAVGNYRRRECH